MTSPSPASVTALCTCGTADAWWRGMEPRHDKRTPEGKLERKQVEAEVESEALETAVGAAAGAITGALAGPVGIAVGAGLGAVAGAALGHQIKTANRERAQHDRDLDDGIVEETVVDDMPGRDSLELDADLEAQAESQRALEETVPFHGLR
jgi:phage tail tape-measure protein